jgi:putrescine transport system substrate-binding protein
VTISRLGFLAFLLLLSACSDESGTDSADDKVVNVYNWADYIDPEVIRLFEAETGIKVNYDTYDSSEVLDVKLLTGNSGYDVINHSNRFSTKARYEPVHEPRQPGPGPLGSSGLV